MAQDPDRRRPPQGGANGPTDDRRTGAAATGSTPAGKRSSQGLTGAQGSGGGAERGIEQKPPRRRTHTDQDSSIRDNSGVAGDSTDIGD